MFERIVSVGSSMFPFDSSPLEEEWIVVMAVQLGRSIVNLEGSSHVQQGEIGHSSRGQFFTFRGPILSSKVTNSQLR